MSFKSDLIEKIKTEGGISLETYMGLCNQHYYNTRDPFGAQGDFTTAPEISQMFGEIIGAWLVDMWGQFGSPPQITLLECGPGRGTLMCDILRVFHKINTLECKINIVLLEQSEPLMMVQKNVLQGHDVTWIGDIQALQTSLSTGPLFVIGNEFFDALPIQQYIFEDKQWRTRGVRYNADKQMLEIYTVPANTCPQPANMPVSKEGDVFETSPVSTQIANTLSALLKTHGGVALFIDYGYTKASYGDSFQAVQAHRFVNPLENPGEADLTAHVNFEMLANILSKNNLNTYGTTMQRQFLTQLGLQQRTEALKSWASAAQKKNIDAAAYRLTATDQMGALFKVIAATSKPLKPAGFL